MKKALALVLLLAGSMALAQDPAPPIQKIYAGGVSYSFNGSPHVGGTAIGAQLLTTTDATTGKQTNTGTYAFMVTDALPTSIKPFNVVTNVGVGVAQKLLTIGKVNIFAPTNAGIAWKGSNTGWAYGYGVLASIHIKGHFYLFPTVRGVKSSISDGTGQQFIAGVHLGWGQ